MSSNNTHTNTHTPPPRETHYFIPYLGRAVVWCRHVEGTEVNTPWKVSLNGRIEATFATHEHAEKGLEMLVAKRLAQALRENHQESIVIRNAIRTIHVNGVGGCISYQGD